MRYKRWRKGCEGDEGAPVWRTGAAVGSGRWGDGRCRRGCVTRGGAVGSMVGGEGCSRQDGAVL